MHFGRRFIAGVVGGVAMLAPVTGLTGEWQYSAAYCAIDNDNSPEANVYLYAGEYRNGDSTYDATLSCGVPMDSGSDPNDLTSVTVYAYDGNDAESVTANLIWLGFSHNNWDSCGTKSSGTAYTGGTSLTFDAADVSACNQHSDGVFLIAVGLPDDDLDFSTVIMIRTTQL